jgi:hypothetical protein
MVAAGLVLVVAGIVWLISQWQKGNKKLATTIWIIIALWFAFSLWWGKCQNEVIKVRNISSRPSFNTLYHDLMVGVRNQQSK